MLLDILFYRRGPSSWESSSSHPSGRARAKGERKRKIFFFLPSLLRFFDRFLRILAVAGSLLRSPLFLFLLPVREAGFEYAICLFLVYRKWQQQEQAELFVVFSSLMHVIECANESFDTP